MLADRAREWIDRLRLTPHPEGGFYREAYRSAESVPGAALPGRFEGGARSFSTAIYFLLAAGDFSALHRIRQDEVWHHYDGDPLTVHVLDDAGGYAPFRLGKGPGAEPLGVVAAGRLFGASVEPPGTYALVGCTVAPGFDFADFELPSRERLLHSLPRHEALVRRLTRETAGGAPA